MTRTMMAAVISGVGGIEMFGITEARVPPVGPSEARVRVHATSVNPLDCKIGRGRYALTVGAQGKCAS